jgi:hypothetical protein
MFFISIDGSNCKMLLHFQNQAFEVLPFQVKDTHRMIGRLGEVMQNPDTPLCIGRSGKDRFPEVFPADCLGAAEGKEDSAWRYVLKCLLIQSASCSAFFGNHILQDLFQRS